jgi:hypothetical protein
MPRRKTVATALTKLVRLLGNSHLRTHLLIPVLGSKSPPVLAMKLFAATGLAPFVTLAITQPILSRDPGHLRLRGRPALSHPASHLSICSIFRTRLA